MARWRAMRSAEHPALSTAASFPPQLRQVSQRLSPLTALLPCTQRASGGMGEWGGAVFGWVCSKNRSRARGGCCSLTITIIRLSELGHGVTVSFPQLSRLLCANELLLQLAPCGERALELSPRLFYFCIKQPIVLDRGVILLLFGRGGVRTVGREAHIRRQLHACCKSSGTFKIFLRVYSSNLSKFLSVARWVFKCQRSTPCRATR